MTLPRLPGDDDILDMIRAGINTIPGIAHKVYGYPTGEKWIRAKSNVLYRLRSLEKYKMVRQTGQTIQVGSRRNGIANVWEVIE